MVHLDYELATDSNRVLEKRNTGFNTYHRLLLKTSGGYTNIVITGLSFIGSFYFFNKCLRDAGTNRFLRVFSSLYFAKVIGQQMFQGILLSIGNPKEFNELMLNKESEVLVNSTHVNFSNSPVNAFLH